MCTFWGTFTKHPARIYHHNILFGNILYYMTIPMTNATKIGTVTYFLSWVKLGQLSMSLRLTHKE